MNYEICSKLKSKGIYFDVQVKDNSSLVFNFFKLSRFLFWYKKKSIFYTHTQPLDLKEEGKAFDTIAKVVLQED